MPPLPGSVVSSGSGVSVLVSAGVGAPSEPPSDGSAEVATVSSDGVAPLAEADPLGDADPVGDADPLAEADPPLGEADPLAEAELPAEAEVLGEALVVSVLGGTAGCGVGLWPGAGLRSAVTSTDEAGGWPQAAVAAVATRTAKVLNISPAPKNIRPTIMPSATGLRSSALTLTCDNPLSMSRPGLAANPTAR
jgi:hypothetical protein